MKRTPDHNADYPDIGAEERLAPEESMMNALESEQGFRIDRNRSAPLLQMPLVLQNRSKSRGIRDHRLRR
jgi:hypothetical protein